MSLLLQNKNRTIPIQLLIVVQYISQYDVDVLQFLQKWVRVNANPEDQEGESVSNNLNHNNHFQ